MSMLATGRIAEDEAMILKQACVPESFTRPEVSVILPKTRPASGAVASGVVAEWKRTSNAIEDNFGQFSTWIWNRRGYQD